MLEFVGVNYSSNYNNYTIGNGEMKSLLVAGMSL